MRAPILAADVVKRIVRSKRAGSTDAAAALAGGINPRTLRRWLRGSTAPCRAFQQVFAAAADRGREARVQAILRESDERPAA